MSLQRYNLGPYNLNLQDLVLHLQCVVCCEMALGSVLSKATNRAHNCGLVDPPLG